MAETSRQIVQRILDHAVEQALPVLRERLETLPGEARDRAERSAEGIRACLGDLAETPGADRQDTLVRLIFGHGDPAVVGALKTFAEVLNFYLMEARDQGLPARKHRDS